MNTRSSSLLSSLPSSPPLPLPCLRASRVEVVLWVSCGGGAVGVVSWWCCGCRVLVVLWVSCPVVVLSSQRGKDTGRRAEPYGAPESGQYPHIWLYVLQRLNV